MQENVRRSNKEKKAAQVIREIAKLRIAKLRKLFLKRHDLKQLAFFLFTKNQAKLHKIYKKGKLALMK